MGSCVSRSTAAARTAGFGQAIATAKVVDSDGSMAQFAAPVTAHEALGDGRRRASCFVCSSDELYFDAPVRALAAHDVLQAGQLYFVLPLPMLGRPLSGQDMAALAVKASAALGAAAVAAVDVDRSSAGAASQGKNGGGAAGNKQRRQTSRVAPLAVVSSIQSEPAAFAERNYHVYGGYDTDKTVYGDRTVRRTREAAGHRSGTTRHRAGVQRSLSVIVEGSG